MKIKMVQAERDLLRCNKREKDDYNLEGELLLLRCGTAASTAS